MMLGPGPPKDRKDKHDRQLEHIDGGKRAAREEKSRKRGASATRKDAAGNGSSRGSGVSRGSEGTTLVSTAAEVEQVNAGTRNCSSGDKDKNTDNKNSSPWPKRKRYHRPDELLWGITSHKTTLHPSSPTSSNNPDSKGDSTTLLQPTPSRTSDASYMIGRNPAVNDMHPPIVSTRPASKAETRWMLQPPPPAKVMEGKLRETDVDVLAEEQLQMSQQINRSRSVSGASKSARSRGQSAITPLRAALPAREAEHEDDDGDSGFESLDTGTPAQAGPSIAVYFSPSSPAQNPNGNIEIVRASSSRSTVRDKTRKRPPLSTIPSETKGLHPGDADREQMENFKFSHEHEQDWKSGWESPLANGERDVRMRWSMDI